MSSRERTSPTGVDITRAICERLKTDDTENRPFTLFYRSVPPTACAVLLHDFADKLDAEQKRFCKEVLLEYSSLPFLGGYAYQIGDGIDAAIAALPLLLQSFPECRQDVKETLLFTLFDRHPIGMNHRLSDHAVATIVNTLRKLSPEDADSLFLAYLYLRPKFSHLCDSMVKENRRKQVFQFEHFRAVQRFALKREIEVTKALRNEITYD